MIRLLTILLVLGVIVGLSAAGGVGYVFYRYGRDLPAHQQLAGYEPPTVTRVHAGDGRLLAEFAKERRVFVPIKAIPLRVTNAFLSAEDQNFYQHPGVDIPAVLRAAVTNLANLGQNKRPVGASTITQQVAKNFLLTNEVSIERKVREALLAFRIEQAISKERILELYLNEIYLGFRSYGVAAAALNYFNKSLDELTVAEAAYLAALPKAPNNYHPIRKPEAAVARRNWVINRMREDGHITAEEAALQRQQPLEVRERDALEVAQADYFAEEVRRELIELYGEDGLYEGGLSVRTTLDPNLQGIAERALRQGLITYDRRHGWRGPVTRIELAGEDWRTPLEALELPPGSAPWQLAVVLSLGGRSAEIGLQGGAKGRIPMTELRWARPWLKEQKVGARPKRPRDVLAAGDVVLVEPVSEDPEGKAYPQDSYALRQIPDVEGGLVAIDPHSGRVLAMTGGFAYARSEFNRVTQAQRQPGSSFKPFVYLAALDSGFTPATIVLDAPFVIDQGAGLGKWKPANYTHKFYGPTPMRVGIEKSRNLMTVRLAQTIGMERVVDYARRFGLIDDMPPMLSMSLGAAETTLVQLTTAYAMLVNGGKRIRPTVIDRVQDRLGVTIYRHDTRECLPCRQDIWRQQPQPVLTDDREQVADPRIAYQVVSMLHGVVERGTGVKIKKKVDKPLAGKTGTSNDAFDTWFIGFSPDLAVGVFVGFDEPRSLGPKETGSSVAAPVFRDFMAEALQDAPATPFRIPPGIRLVRINAETGQVARAGDSRIILEAFLPGTLPTGERLVIDGGVSTVSDSPAFVPATGDGAETGTGIY
ncbi:MAG: penicillin-binding protein 1A [Kiloniellales bacterium]|nr:penicillin-binding protein 1A [Kiloniellales bacterium]